MTEADMKILEKANEFREFVLPKADDCDTTGPLWYGWVIVAAFVAGYKSALADFPESVP